MQSPTPFENGRVILQATGLNWSYMEAGHLKQVLSGLDLTINAGETVALVGASGSGKSTLLNLIGGIDRLEAGEIILQGMPLHAMKEPVLTLYRRQHIGYVYQLFNLIPTLSVEENAALPLELLSVPLDERRRETDLWLDRVGLLPRRHAFPDQLSGGEQQRVALVRALIHKPALVLADEPTGNLDAGSGRKILDLMISLAEENGQTLLIVTHSREVATRCNRVLHLEAGRVTEQLSPGQQSAW